MRWVTLGLAIALLLVQAELWMGKVGVMRKVELEAALAEQRGTNDARQARNDRLRAEVRDLEDGLEMVEEKARLELGMLRPDEILVQISTRR